MNRRPHLVDDHGVPLCPEWAERERDSDGDQAERLAEAFGLKVGPDVDEQPFELEEVTGQYEPCPVCHQVGACSFDDEGRPMLHVVPSEWADTDPYVETCGPRAEVTR